MSNKEYREPLLMIHGIISDGSFFEKISEYLHDDFDIVTYDRTGYGDMLFDANADFSVAGQAEMAATILDEKLDGPAWILGNSAGGLIAIELAIRYPLLVKGLLLVEPSLSLDDESEELIRSWNDELNGYLKEKKIKKALTAFARVVDAPREHSASESICDLKRTYKNLNTFMYGELNYIQRYKPNLDDLLRIKVPVRVIITEGGKNSIFARTSVNGAEVLGWNVDYVKGYHNTIKDNPMEMAQYIRDVIGSI